VEGDLLNPSGLLTGRVGTFHHVIVVRLYTS
jgi:hypothetical protein